MCMEQLLNGEDPTQLTQEETDELVIRLKKRVIAMSDPNKFDLDQSWAKIGGVTSHVTSQPFLALLAKSSQNGRSGECEQTA